jgi:hypothetical protein
MTAKTDFQTFFTSECIGIYLIVLNQDVIFLGSIFALPHPAAPNYSK